MSANSKARKLKNATGYSYTYCLKLLQTSAGDYKVLAEKLKWSEGDVRELLSPNRSIPQ